MRFLLPGKIYFLTLLFLFYLRVALGESGFVGVEQGKAENGVNQSVPSENSTKASPTISAAALGKSGSVSLEQGQVVNGVNRSVPHENSTKASSTVSGADSSKTPQPVLVIQTPTAVKVMEGSTQRMECCILQFNSPIWYILWFKNGTESALTNSSRMSIITREKERCSHLILSKTEIADSGIYRCILHDHGGNRFPSNGTQLTIDDLANSNREPNKQPGTSLGTIGAGAGAGVAILLLVVAGVIIWKRRSKVSRSELETSPAKEIGLHPPLVSQPSEVAYADLHFNKREVRPDAEVIYAEVRTPQKRQACQDAKQMRPTGNQRR
ncbi:PREDICTED: uncharacterized protein LOC107111792 [Gekko japonicus]|uniref:Uncharacterized protein LOC107111792 n=1 Tax=Gekko japonicus TaxID=146911 RepID=A0ABM1K3M2_GEKJA|nr:PREDICTED: uncharacterized protein LOC107111792 [Gekko japonicus]